MIGIDGACWDVLDRFGDALPNLSALKNEGAHGVLRSVIPPLSAPAWASFMTGSNPGKHGIYGFKMLRPGTRKFDFVSGSHRAGESLWGLLSRRGRRVVVINVPMTYPASPVNGVLVSGMDSPGTHADFVHPKELRDDLLRRFPGYRIHLHLAGYLVSDRRKRKALAEILDMVEWRKRLAVHLVEQTEWELFVVVFTASDRVQHYFWQDMERGGEFSDAVELVYRAIDSAVGEIVRRIPDAAVFVMSDHGAGAFGGKTIYLAEWLRQKGYLVPKGRGGAVQGAIRSSVDVLRRLLPSGPKDFLNRHFPGLRGRLHSYAGLGNIDWSSTRAFFGENTNTIRLNSRRTFDDGIVTDAEYDGLREEIIAHLDELRDPADGERLITKTYRREELYAGPRAATAPDIVVVPGEFAYATTKRLRPDGQLVETAPHSLGTNGVHRLDGVFMVRGSGIKRGPAPLSSIMDLAPTILCLMGERVPRWMDGKLMDVFASPVEVEYCDETMDWGASGTQYSPAEAREMEERLRGLGYVE